MVKLLAGTNVKFHLQNTQWLEKLLLQFSPLRLRNAHHARQPSLLFSQEVHNEFILTVFYRAEHHSLRLHQHVGKITNIFSNCQIIPPHNETFCIQKCCIFYVFVNIKKIHHKPQPSDHQAFAVKGKRDPPQPPVIKTVTSIRELFLFSKTL